MAEEAVEDVLQRVRETNIAERLKRREDIYNKQREFGKVPGRCLGKQYKEKDIVRATRALSQHSADKEEAFSDLKSSFLQSPCHVLTFMKSEGGLHALVGALLQPNYQLLAAECCCNLSLGDSKTCYKLAKSATPYLLNILLGMNLYIKNVVLQTLSNLSGCGEKICELLYSQGILQALEKTLTIPELRENTTKALIMFVRNGSSCMVESDFIELATAVLPYFEHSGESQWLMYLLSTQPCVIPTLVEKDIPMKVLKTLCAIQRIQQDNIVSVTALLRLLGNLTGDQRGDAAKQMLESWSMTVRVITLLRNSEYRHLRKEIYWVVGNTLEHKKKFANNKVEPGKHMCGLTSNLNIGPPDTDFE